MHFYSPCSSIPSLATIIHQKPAEAAELIEDKSPYYKYTPANVLDNANLKLHWNRSTLTD